MTGSIAQRQPSAADVSIPKAAPSKRTYSLKEVEEHKTWGDCWTVLDGEVYDISDWVDTHPGGSVIRLALGRYVSLCKLMAFACLSIVLDVL